MPVGKEYTEQSTVVYAVSRWP